ncbi:MAG: dTDP-4-dehydrorhamnose 3,5-epimerase [Hymenobacteraceae bacterium]|nr:dTDP-4-dehydrorhamnose 3,5-epimerase [Hymenobacteraceae bacterium]MDX5397806.1 dTDP-4-dehydrorhamnose 3,5-epimerase [Hymenobacteraceae bacterium]MDX5513885.1 dTDP-4-dehydrorhamnose 3,5-epimerase [Hymenobacteraceae bacterium]
MEIKEYPIKGVVELFPKIFGDARGSFMESYNRKVMESVGIDVEFVQDNQSVSSKNVLRGLHFQKPPFAQAKLVRVAKGKALDVAVDIRKDSPTYGQHVTCLLDAEKGNMLYVPEGFAHGFVALEDDTLFMYKCSNYYNKESEGGIIWNDPELNIDWGVENPLVSEKDEILPRFEVFESVF